MDRSAMEHSPELIAEMRHLAPLYRRFADRPHLLGTLERECGLRRVPPTDPAVMTGAALSRQCELLHAHGEPHMAAWLASEIDLGAGEGLAYYLRSHRTLREALFELIRIRSIWLPHGQIALQSEGQALRVSIRPLHPLLHVGQHDWWEGTLTWVIRVLQHSMSAHLPLYSACVMTPGSSTPGRLAALLGTEVTFHAPEYGFVFDATVLDRRLPGGNDRIRRAMQASVYVMAQYCRAPGGTHLCVLGWMRSLDTLAGMGIDDAAGALKTTEASLRRQLASEGSRFSDLLRAFRREQAFERLAIQGIRAESCAMSLGYVNRAAFERAFKTWFSETPAQVRRHTLLLAGPQGNQDWCSPSRLARHVPDIPVLPSHTGAAASDPSAQEDRLLLDPVLQAYTVGMANKAWYGGQVVHAPRTAIRDVLGSGLTHNLSLAVNMHSQREDCATTHRWWRKARQQAALMRRWVEAVGGQGGEPSHLVLAAGWYELGVLPLLTQYPKAAAVCEGESSGLPRNEIMTRERNLIGIDRHQAGALLLSAWTLPSDMVAAVRSGHAPSRPSDWLLAAAAECAHAMTPAQATAAQLNAIHDQLRAAGLPSWQRDLCLQRWAELPPA